MRWPLPRPVYLTLENDDIDLKPLGVEELLRPVLERALFATKAMGAAIALRGRTEMVCMAPQGTCSRSRDAFRPKIRVFRNVCEERPDSILRRRADGSTS